MGIASINLLDENFESNIEYYGVSFFENYNKLSFLEKELFKNILNMLNGSLSQYQSLYSILKFNTKSNKELPDLFNKSCLELIFYNLSYIYSRIAKDNPRLYKSNFLNLLDFIIERSIEKETKLFSKIEELSYEEIWENRIVQNVEIFNYMFLSNDTPSYIYASAQLFNNLLDPINYNPDIDNLVYNFSQNKQLAEIAYSFIKDVNRILKENIIDRFQCNVN